MSSNLPGIFNFGRAEADTWTQPLRLTRDGAPLDLTSCTVAAAARSSLGDLTDLPVTIVGDGALSIEAPAAGLAADLYSYDLEVSNTNGVVETWLRGRIRIRGSVSDSLPER